MDLPVALDLVGVQGDDFSHRVQLTDPNGVPLDISLSTFQAQIRRSSKADLIASFTIVKESPLVGIVDFQLPNTSMDDLEGLYMWDCQQIKSGLSPRTILGGRFSIIRGVTRFEATYLDLPTEASISI